MDVLQSQTAEEVCERIKKLGYSIGQHIRLYGHRWEVMSDPFPQAGLIALKVRTKRDPSERVIYLPATVLQVACRGVVTVPVDSSALSDVEKHQTSEGRKQKSA